jgi:hypothetical protein
MTRSYVKRLPQPLSDEGATYRHFELRPKFESEAAGNCGLLF